MPKRKLNNKQEKEICQKYKDGLSSYILGKKFKVSDVTILNTLKRNNIKRRSHSEPRMKYYIDEKAFDNITPESAYWIGFLMADGCITEPKNYFNRLSIHLSIKDIKHLKKFKSFLDSEHKIGKYSDYSCGFFVNSTKLCNTLKKYGVVPRKSLTAKASLELENNKHFWRGAIDGDGCISFYKPKHKKYPRISLCGSYNLMLQFAVFCEKIINKNINVRKTGSIYLVSICGEKAKKIISHLYSNSNIHLDRKYNKAMEIIKDFS